MELHRGLATIYLVASLAAAFAGPDVPGALPVPRPALRQVVDIPLPGRTTRFDYQSWDTAAQVLYLAHMGDGEIVVLNLPSRTVTARLRPFPSVTGVLVVPELHRLFASVPGNHEVAIFDTDTLALVVRLPAGAFPDGLAYAPEAGKVFVSDERGGQETVIDARTCRRLGAIDLGGEAGNTQYDPGRRRMLVTVQSRNELVIIDPQTDTILSRHPLEGGRGPHGLLVAAPKRLAFVACEDDAKLLVVDLDRFAVMQVCSTGSGPDVLAFDEEFGRLYVASECGSVSVFQLHARILEKLEDFPVAPSAHSVSVDVATHEVYFPLKEVEGHPVLRVMTPSPP